MHILHSLLSELKEEFANSRKSEERGPWFAYTLLAIILPFTSSRTSNLLRALETLFGFSIRKKKYYRFMASPKVPWSRLWIRLWKLIPEPETNGRLIVALDDFIGRGDYWILWCQVKNRGLIQRTKKGYRQCRNPNQKCSSSYKPLRILYDGYYIDLDLCLQVGENSKPETCCKRSKPFRLFRCAQAGCESGHGR